MSRCKVMSLVLIIGIGIGSIVPAAMSWWYNSNRDVMATNTGSLEAVSTDDDYLETPETKVIYHFKLEDGVLSVIEGQPGTNGRTIVTGLDVHTWPKELQDIAPKVEFYSLDEVQSFIDTVNEPLWSE